MSLEETALPRSAMQAIFKRAAPQALLQKDVKASLPHVASVFINYLVANSSELVSKSDRKTITAKDILQSLQVMEMDDLLAPLNQALTDYRSLQASKKTGKELSSKDIISTATVDATLEEDSYVDQQEETGVDADSENLIEMATQMQSNVISTMLVDEVLVKRISQTIDFDNNDGRTAKKHKTQSLA